MTTLAFTNTTHTKEQAVALATWHYEQDNYLRSTYGKKTPKGWKGCSVGCMSEGQNHEDYPKLFGIDTRIAYLSDKLFENMTEYKSFTVKLFSSVKEGIDTTNAYYRFMHWMLMDSEHGVVKIKNSKELRTVGLLFERAIAGDVPTTKKWRNAANASYDANLAAHANAVSRGAYANAANAAAYAAAYDAAYASYAATNAANAAHAAAYAAYNAANAANAAADAAEAALAASRAANAAADAAANAAAKQKHYNIMVDKLCYFLAGGV